MSLDEPEPVDSVLTFLSGYDTLEYSWVKTTAVSVRLRILFVTLQNTNSRLASPRPAGLGVLPCVHRPSDSGSDYFLEVVGSWYCVDFVVARPASLGVASWSPSGPSRPLTWPRPCSSLEHSPGKWVPAIFVLLGCLVNLWMSVEAF